MTDTPLTDEAAFISACRREVVRADFARELERQRAYWMKMYECAQNANVHRQAALDALDTTVREER